MPTLYAVGQTTRLTTTVKDPATGAFLDPTTIALLAARPDSAVISVTTTRDSLGTFHADLPLDQPGRWQYWWATTGTGAAGGGGELVVDVRLVETTPGPAGTHRPATVVTVDDVKDHLQILGADVREDAKILGYIESAEQTIADLAGPTVPEARVETFRESAREPLGRGDYGGYWDRRTYVHLTRAPVLALTAVSGDLVYALADVVLEDDDRGKVVFPGPVRNVTITYTAGRTSVPPRIRLATLELIRHWYGWGQLGGANAGADVGWQAGAGFAVPARVVQLLGVDRTLPGIA